ncbi:hypothetical protein [Clostridium manihotivorum]|uniref:hypothetical protein n=1 Tax=Clostridium manihotivorum TaxID=2320868 RepID=UPI0013E385F1|nr:hypothetical protein [Clostridium manihotivorum]
MKLNDKQAKIFAIGGILLLSKYCDIMASDKIYYLMWGAMTIGLLAMPNKKNKDGEK